MKRSLIACCFLFLFFLKVAAQNITGTWNGLLKVQGMQLRLVFHVQKNGTGFSSTMDSPDQKASGIPVESTSFSDNKVIFSLPNLKISYAGQLVGGRIEGTFSQGGMQVPMNLERGEVVPQKLLRPQEPLPPFPYRQEDVSFSGGAAGVQIEGTLTLPASGSKFPVVILITGSGPQDRNGELFGHKPFLLIADYLTRNGIAVLRYDERGVGKSTGSFSTATSNGFAADVRAAVAFAKSRKDLSEIGLIGHSEGGLIAPMVAADSKDVAFIVMLAGPGLRGDKLLLQQQELIARAAGAGTNTIARQKAASSRAFDIVVKSKDRESLLPELRSYLDSMANDTVNSLKPANITAKDFVELQMTQITSPWMLNFIKYDPAVSLAKVKCPVLALNGSVDLQVPSKENLAAIKSSLEKAGNKRVTTKELPGLNHLFQESRTGAPSEYGNIEQTFSPVALQEILAWIQRQTKN